MKRIRLIAAFVFAALVGALVGNGSRPQVAQATAINVSVQCNQVTLGGDGRFLYTCANAPGDASGITVNMTISAPTQRYPLGTPATLTLP